ncbi:hypothetical protein GCM10010275_38690 [Streptomyces litmocidini]|uniref:hypothetical protein n=1 Tax=Streptomyces litmocidini TaxID=67318 RepID=UPI00167EA2C4|nr:hypothetical protein [Streptomyces litmocidini]GGU96780.1 hypothetical protein GCM10010275_38690 [Streptomyces litmocidini]
MPDEPEVPESLESECEDTLRISKANIDLSEKGLRIVLDEEQLADLGNMLDQNSECSPGCISMPGGPRC